MRDFDCDLRAGVQIRGAENGGHAASRNQLFQPEVVHLVARV
jgi:hypothetical protein